MAQEQAIRVTLSTNKVILMRVPTIAHQEQAMRLVGNKAGKNTDLNNLLTSMELLKILIARIDDTPYTLRDWETQKIDSVLSIVEVKQCVKALEQYTGGEDDFLPPTEAVVIGETSPG